MRNKVFILLFFIIGIGLPTLAQSHLWKYTSCHTDTTIIRKWKDSKYLVYSESGTVHKVTLHDVSTYTTKSALIPSIVHINDFRIEDDYVFAGGYILYASTKSGLLACFDINELLIGSGTFNYLQFNKTDMTNSCCSTRKKNLITEVKRISLFKDGEVTRIAFIADNNILDYDNTNIINMRQVGYGDASFCERDSPNWTVNQYHYNKDGVEKYTDIACTDKHIVITAKDKEENWFHFMVFDKTANFANYCPLSPPIYYFSDHSASERVMVTECEHDVIAVAYNYHEPGNTGIAVKILNVGSSTPTLYHSIDIPLWDSASVGTMRDICYYSSGNFLRFLTDADSPKTGMWGHSIYTVDINNILSGVSETISNSDVEFHSLDIFLNDGFIASGMHSGFLHVYDVFDLTSPDSCGHTQVVSVVPTEPAFRSFGRHHCIIVPTVTRSTLLFTTFNEDLDNLCITQKNKMP